MTLFSKVTRVKFIQKRFQKNSGLKVVIYHKRLRTLKCQDTSVEVTFQRHVLDQERASFVYADLMLFYCKLVILRTHICGARLSYPDGARLGELNMWFMCKKNLIII